MTCQEAEGIVAKWENGFALEKSEGEGVSLHIAECPACGSRIGPLMPFILHDLNGLPPGGKVHAGRMPEVPDIASAVMDRLSSRGPSAAWRRFFAAGRALPVFALALVLFLAGAGVLLRPRSLVTVSFVVDAPGAKSVSLAGDFTDWKPDVYKLSRGETDGRWKIEVTLQKDRLYTYNFIIDGVDWIPDPSSPYHVDDGFGGKSSLLQL